MVNSSHAVRDLIEKPDDNFSAYAPDLPGCVSTSPTIEATELSMREAIQFHLDGLREDGLPIPEPVTVCQYIDAD